MPTATTSGCTFSTRRSRPSGGCSGLARVGAGPETAPGGKIGREAAEPVAPLVVLAGDGRQPPLAMQERRAPDGGEPRVAGGQAGGDPLEHPGAAQVQSVEMRELG